MTDCRTVSVSLHRSPDEVYNYLADPNSFPQWSVYITDIKQEGEVWNAATISGPVQIRFTPKNGFRILDHYVTVSPELTVYVPMRVVPNPEGGCEVLFTIFRLSGMDDAAFEKDVQMVMTDLRHLKEVLESKS